ncbi:MAG: hypothetical protein KF767_01680 [Bdellovibrionaceae bacterium]|nr:hypothetical protein [Pseudobdellovibrionaceae bacterium]
MNFDSRRRYFKNFPKLTGADREDALLIFDAKLARSASPLIRQFRRRIAVRAGEGLKSFAQAEKVLGQMLKKTADARRSRLRIFVLGGGSVGDFGGFCASVLRRGTPVVQIPSTWLAAVDSAHGGKTALNLAGAKNQVGTYWPAEEVWLIEKLLRAQPAALALDARGEVYKSALIAGGALFKMVGRATTPWPVLKPIIDTKMKVVRADPREQKGLRHTLNLGHTVGHVLESARGLSHGRAVLYGLAFAVEWRRHEMLMAGHFRLPRWLDEVRDWPGWPTAEELRRELRGVRDWTKRLDTDKKSLGGGRLRFIFPLEPGRIDVQTRRLADLVAEIERQAE